MKNTYIFNDLDNYTMTFSNDIRMHTTKVIRSLRISLRRTGKYHLIDKLNQLHPTRKCAFCNTCLESNKFLYLPDVSDGHVTLRSAGHIKDKSWGQYYKCTTKTCHGNKLNSNSIEFIRNVYHLSFERAKHVIHTRNSSPFYANNHETESDYKRFQSLKERIGDQKFQEILKKQEQSRQRNKEQYIADYGQDSWVKLMKRQRDSSSLEFFRSQYDNEDDAVNAFNQKNSKTAQFAPGPDDYDNFDRWWAKHYSHILTIEDFHEHISSKIKEYSDLGKCLMLSRMKLRYPGLYIGMHRFGVTNIYRFLDVNESVYKIRNNYNTNMFAYQSTVDGFFFRSAAELDFYLELKECDVKILNTNKQYPKSRWHYDFKIEYQGQIYFIELCSDIDQEYIDKMLAKQKNLHNCILVSNKLTAKFIAAIVNKTDISKENFYGHS